MRKIIVLVNSLRDHHAKPPLYHAALAGNSDAKKAWAALIPSRKKEALRYLSGLKSPEALARNVEKAMRVLFGEKGRFMARDWEGGG